MRFPIACLVLSLSVVCSRTSFAQEAAEPSPSAFDQGLWEALEWREVGPYRGGRSAAVAGLPADRDTYYFGAAGGGVWKTGDGGLHWNNVSDGFFGGSIGAVAVSAWDPNVVYAGGGEVTVRGNVSHGDGMWRSTDAGKTWKHVGLADSRHITRIHIHPKNADVVYAAVLGHLYGPNQERGIYRSTDGGENWERILFVDENVGSPDLCMDPSNPRILYASTWRIRRTPYSMDSGGEGSGLWKSTDGGDSWESLNEKQGMPAAPIGICGITVSASNPENIYAIVEADEGGVFRSQDGGETWTRTNEQRDLRQRAWYYSRIYADPVDEEALYVVNVQFHHSKDGGKSFQTIRTPHGDNHDMWIDPADPQRMIEANDGGANVSYDGGASWSTQTNQPTAQMYRLSTDDDFPYRILGGQQDNSAVRIRSRSFSGSAISTRDWEPTSGGESGHIVAKPGEPHIVYGGSYGGFLTRINHRTGEMRAVNVWPDNPLGWGAAKLKYRFNWNFPILFSPHDANTLYAAGNALFRSRDEGASWQAISPDLTRDEKAKQASSGGPITQDNTSVEYYCTIFAVAESKQEAGVIWCGSDDGLVHLTRDGGESWENVTPEGLPSWTMVNSIDLDPFEPGGLYLAGTRYKLDDFEPYLFHTGDYGKSWQRIDHGIDRGHFTRVLRADPARPGLLYAGTERGVYVSFDEGANWDSLQIGLPEVPVTDLEVKNGDLVVATQGRGYWVLDDLSPVRQWAPAVAGVPSHFFWSRPAYRLRGGRRDEPVNEGTNPPAGAIFSYYVDPKLAEDAGLKLELSIMDKDGLVLRSFTREREPGAEDEGAAMRHGLADSAQLPFEGGLNRFTWDLRYDGAENFADMVLWSGGRGGPMVAPGHYRVRMKIGEVEQEIDLEVLMDPRSSSTPEQVREQVQFLLGVRDKVTEMHQAIRRVREVRGPLEGLKKRLEENEEHAGLAEQAGGLLERLKGAEEALYQTQNKSPQDPLNFPVRLNDKLSALSGGVSVGDYAPTEQAKAVRVELESAIDVQLEALEVIWKRDLPDLDRRALEAGFGALPAKAGVSN
ncbi:MAG: photosystem II stability/assembly factor-like uncharacterized protein [Planctomycetota bacterium]|jgi:photosystem II stability/assembly factor-like uncharacterized protein